MSHPDDEHLRGRPMTVDSLNRGIDPDTDTDPDPDLAN